MDLLLTHTHIRYHAGRLVVVAVVGSEAARKSNGSGSEPGGGRARELWLPPTRDFRTSPTGTLSVYLESTGLCHGPEQPSFFFAFFLAVSTLKQETSLAAHVVDRPMLFFFFIVSLTFTVFLFDIPLTRDKSEIRTRDRN